MLNLFCFLIFNIFILFLFILISCYCVILSLYAYMPAKCCRYFLSNVNSLKVSTYEWCCMCKNNGESIGHLLLHCEVARELWSYILSLFGVEWVMPRQVLDLLTSWALCLEVVLPRKFGGWFRCI
jgi:hypothetical protein